MAPVVIVVYIGMSAESYKKIWSKYNPLARLRRYRMKKRLHNYNITFLCPNCIGGILFHDLGLRFMSPTVNLMMTQTDFLKFVLNIDHYLNEKFIFYTDQKYNCPCAHLSDINIHFTHYETEHEAENKWKDRVKRIQKDNIFIFLEERDGLTKEEILKLSTLKVKGIVVFTANKYEDIPYAVFIKKYQRSGQIGNILKRSLVDDSREYEHYFDFIKWFNNANEGDYDISKFIR